MRDRPFLAAGEQPRPYGDIKAERAMAEPRTRVLADIADLEARARESTDPIEREALQCEAEDLRCALSGR